jgi:ADP-ribose pyrophosphatase YjhB (NUDIX family)
VLKGIVEEGETLRSAALRELKEESGLTLLPELIRPSDPLWVFKVAFTLLVSFFLLKRLTTGWKTQDLPHILCGSGRC